MLSAAPHGEPFPVQASDHWYKDAVLYEIHVRAFRDSDGDGIGDFRGLIEKLDYLQGLGVTALWLLPFYPSPLRDDGYDIADYREVHPSYGTLRDFRAFLREAHRRGIRVVTELVLAHTSDEHPWFQRARRARPGSVERDFYLWSDTPDRFGEARVIFHDFEVSNWTFDPVAGAYFWHRFYSHQPSLNYDNPAVRRAMFDTVDFWLGMGVDGLRLDAVPYLFAREGTTCENLPETFDFLRQLRAHVDARFDDRMLLAEANQWPEDAAAYMAQGDVCQMAFHFPLMPRMFMAARQEDRFPVVDILTETPAIDQSCQWALFLRNHDELTLEMVTDEERDYMYRAYAQDSQARVNMGIRRRLAPLLGNDRKMIEMMNGLLFSLPGTPIVYYGDEIGMGDNIYLGDRDAVRTPMQWDGDRNAGFSRANPQRLYLPVVTDPEYHSQAVNVEAQAENSSSLLWWMKRLIGLRQRYRAFGRGSLELLRPDNRKVLAFIRRYEEERILVVVNLSRFAQGVELNLSEYRGATPIEVFGNMPFPKVGDLPYFVTLGPHGFYWFSLETEKAAEPEKRAAFRVTGEWDALFRGRALREFESFLPSYVAQRRWFGQKTRAITSATVVDAVRIPGPAGSRERAVAVFLVVRLELNHGGPEHYSLPVSFAGGQRAEDLVRWNPDAVVADLQTGDGAGVLCDAVYEPEFVGAMVELLSRRRGFPGSSGRLVGVPTAAFRRIAGLPGTDVVPVPLTADQSNSSVALGDRAIVKFVRRFEEGTDPGVEIGRFLTARRFTHAPAIAGSVEYRSDTPGTEAATVVVAQEFVPNEGDGWNYVVDALTHGLEEVLAHPDAEELRVEPPPGLLSPTLHRLEPGHLLVGPHLQWASLLGRRTAELHLALTTQPSDRAFEPEPLTAVDRRALYHGAGSLTRRVFRQMDSFPDPSPLVREVLSRQAEIIGRLGILVHVPIEAKRIRCHGDFHLGQVLWTGKDFVIIDFEGEPARAIGHRRLKRPAAVDIAGMVRSLHYASRASALRLSRDLPGSVASVEPVILESWLTQWYRWVARTFVASYLEVAGDAGFLPADRRQLSALLDFFLLEKAVYELGYEMNSRPNWVDVPARGVLDLLQAGT
ncbi:MAG TPA: maltose alpha-D-glucosyltransferase [Acidimicrobiales bacterium]|nr:maltose alpha-D-glucosyltransferase [Acidimicrobiales bacterium]